MTLAYEIRAADYANLADRQALLALLDAYACDPMGGAQPLSEAVKTRLCDALGAFNGARSWLAWHGSQPVGLLNAFWGFQPSRQHRYSIFTILWFNPLGADKALAGRC